MQQIQFIDQPFFLEEFDRPVNSDQVYAGIDALGARKNLVHIEMLFGVVHHLKNHAPLTGQTDAALAKSFGEMAGGFRSVDALAGRSAMRGRGGGHDIPFGDHSCVGPGQECIEIKRTTSLYMT